MGRRELARLVAKTNRAKSDLRDLVRKWRRHQAESATPDREIWKACADDAPSKDGEERWLDHGEK